MSERYNKSEKHLLIELDERNGDSIFFAKRDDGTIGVEIDEPWAGSTETGFGATTYATLTADDVRLLTDWLASADQKPA